jgi:excisionase family DNA binding protein
MILTSIMSTSEAAKASGVSRITLERWLAAGKIARPKILKVGRRKFRLWTGQDVERVKKFKAKHYRKGRGRKPKNDK